MGAWNSPVEVHEVIVTIEQPSGEPITPGHLEAKSKLLDNLRKDQGTWNTNHPRHRVLDALHGFSRYHERQKVELDRIKGLYKQVSKPQRLVDIPRPLYLTLSDMLNSYWEMSSTTRSSPRSITYCQRTSNCATA